MPHDHSAELPAERFAEHVSGELCARLGVRCVSCRRSKRSSASSEQRAIDLHRRTPAESTACTHAHSMHMRVHMHVHNCTHTLTRRARTRTERQNRSSRQGA
eukprot:1883900-Rhodomonas_salina.2